MPEPGEDRDLRARRCRKAVNAYFMWHTGQLPGISREWLDQQAERTSHHFMEQ